MIQGRLDINGFMSIGYVGNLHFASLVLKLLSEIGNYNYMYVLHIKEPARRYLEIGRVRDDYQQVFSIMKKTEVN